MAFAEQTIQTFTDALASNAPTPGGGGASALAGTLAAALGSMVGALTVGKPKYAAVEADVKTAMARLETLRAELLALTDRDAEAFEPLSRAYGIPKDDPARETVMEAALQAAAAVPLEIMRAVSQVILVQAELSEKGSVLALSDAGVGAALAGAALTGASLNVFINTKYMTDRARARSLEAEADAMLAEFGPIAEATAARVLARYHSQEARNG